MGGRRWKKGRGKGREMEEGTREGVRRCLADGEGKGGRERGCRKGRRRWRWGGRVSVEKKKGKWRLRGGKERGSMEKEEGGGGGEEEIERGEGRGK